MKKIIKKFIKKFIKIMDFLKDATFKFYLCHELHNSRNVSIA